MNLSSVRRVTALGRIETLPGDRHRPHLVLGLSPPGRGIGSGSSSPVTGSVMQALRMRLIGEPAMTRACGRQ